jgi:signal transduction histidine kinase
MVEAHSSISTARRTGRLAAAPNLLQAAIEALTAPVAILAGSGVVLGTNEAWRAASTDEDGACCPEGENYLDWQRTMQDDIADATLMRGMSRVLAGAQKRFERSRRLSAATELNISVRRVDGAVPARFLVTHVFVSGSAAEEVEERVLAAQIEERERIATELHDSVGQNLVCLGLGLTRLRRLTQPDSEIAGVVGDMSALLQEAHAEIRTISFLLQPPWLEERGVFSKAVCDLVAGFGRRAGLQATVEAQEIPSLCRGRQLTLFRILQEALVNIHRHARADTVTVELVKLGRQVVLTVRDNGRGMLAAEGVAPNAGVGILGMRARLRKWGGDLRIVTGPEGTTLVAKLLA